MEISVQTFDRICRICLVESVDMKSLFTKIDGEERNLFEILAFTANISVKCEDILPKQVCGECQSIMCKADEFKRRCIDSDTILNNIYQNSINSGESSNITNRYSIKDENEDMTPNLANFTSFQHSNVTNYTSQDKKNVFLQDTTTYPQAQTSFCNLKDYKEFKNHDQVIKEEVAVNFEEEIDFSDHFNDSQFETIPIEYKKEKPLKTEGITYPCYCGLKFTTKDKHKTHLKQENCNKFNKLLEKVNKKKSITIKNQIQCVDCDSKFDTPHAWKLHQKVHQNTELSKKLPGFYACKICPCQFKTEASLATHIQKHENSINDKTELYQCSLCLRKFKNKKSLTAHIKKHEATDHIKHICKICKRDFKYKAYLENHILTMHSKKNGISCEVCAQSFPNEDSLELHKDSHKNEKKHCCIVCNKGFLMLCTLKEHMRTHTGEKPFLCSQCGKGFSQKTNLAQHMRRHQGLKPFKCENCEKRFVSKGELDAHNRKHSGAHPFVCDDCGNGFTTSSSLNKHRRIHTGEKPYLCDLCPMRFAASGTLKNHRRTHTGERPFQCSHCEKAFVQRNDLISHIRCHTGEKPYICTQCGMTFRKASGLKSHVKMHVKDPVQQVGLMQGVNLMMNGMHCTEQ